MQEGKKLQSVFRADELRKIDQFRREQDDIPTIAETIRELVKRGLTASEPKLPKGRAAS